MREKRVNAEGDVLLKCSYCGQWLPIYTFTTRGKYYSYGCKPCEAERVSRINLHNQIKRKGVGAVRLALLEEERCLERRKRFFREYVGED